MATQVFCSNSPETDLISSEWVFSFDCLLCWPWKTSPVSSLDLQLVAHYDCHSAWVWLRQLPYSTQMPEWCSPLHTQCAWSPPFHCTWTDSHRPVTCTRHNRRPKCQMRLSVGDTVTQILWKTEINFTDLEYFWWQEIRRATQLPSVISAVIAGQAKIAEFDDVLMA